MTWLNLPEAAAALGLSERSVRRRIDAGRLQMRREGRRVQVDVQIGDTAPSRQLSETAAALAVKGERDGQRFDHVVDTLTAAGMTARQEARTARRWATVAVFALVACLTTAGTLATLLTGRLATAEAATVQAHACADVSATRADQLQVQLDAAVRHMHVAQNGTAELRGRLAATQATVDGLQVDLQQARATVGGEVLAAAIATVQRWWGGDKGLTNGYTLRRKPAPPPVDLFGDPLAER